LLRVVHLAFANKRLTFLSINIQTIVYSGFQGEVSKIYPLIVYHSVNLVKSLRDCSVFTHRSVARSVSFRSISAVY
jgi:hypothetical protein